MHTNILDQVASSREPLPRILTAESLTPAPFKTPQPIQYYQLGKSNFFDNVLKTQSQDPEIQALADSSDPEATLKLIAEHSYKIVSEGQTVFVSGVLELQRINILEHSQRHGCEVKFFVKFLVDSDSDSDQAPEIALTNTVASKSEEYALRLKPGSSPVKEDAGLKIFLDLVEQVSRAGCLCVDYPISEIQALAENGLGAAIKLLGDNCENLTSLCQRFNQVFLTAQSKEDFILSLTGVPFNLFKEVTTFQEIIRQELPKLLPYAKQIMASISLETLEHAEINPALDFKSLTNEQALEALAILLETRWFSVSTNNSINPTILGYYEIAQMISSDHFFGHTHPVSMVSLLTCSEAQFPAAVEALKEKAPSAVRLQFEFPTEVEIQTIRSRLPAYIQIQNSRMAEKATKLTDFYQTTAKVAEILEAMATEDFPQCLLKFISDSEPSEDPLKYPRMLELGPADFPKIEDSLREIARNIDNNSNQARPLFRSVLNFLTQTLVQARSELIDSSESHLATETLAAFDQTKQVQDLDIILANSGSSEVRSGTMSESDLDSDYLVALTQNYGQDTPAIGVIFSALGTVIGISHHPSPSCLNARLYKDRAPECVKFTEYRTHGWISVDGTSSIILSPIFKTLEANSRISTEPKYLSPVLIVADPNCGSELLAAGMNLLTERPKQLAWLFPIDHCNPYTNFTLNDYFMSGALESDLEGVSVSLASIGSDSDKAIMVSFSTDINDPKKRLKTDILTSKFDNNIATLSIALADLMSEQIKRLLKS
jgi:hypothetical protein